MSQAKTNPLPLLTGCLHPGMRLGVAVSGGADSVALLRVLARRRQELGLVLTALHVHHGIRGAEADGDASFAEGLAKDLGVRFLRNDVNTPERAQKAGESIEEAARNLRYAWFDELLGQGELDAVATAHTLDDQAETVLLKLLRGAWTEGLAGIFPVLKREKGAIVRPFLETRRSEIQAWLREVGQSWREDSTNQDVVYARNRVRHHLLPILEEYNPQIASHLACLSEIARDEEAYWQAELARILPSLLLPGKPVRGGGRAISTHPEQASVGMEVERLRGVHPAMRRRVLRAAAEQLGACLNFDQTELLLELCEGKAGRRQVLTAELRAERSPRELRLVRSASAKADAPPEYEFTVPGQVVAEAFGLRLTVSVLAEEFSGSTARLRAYRSGDRVQLRYSSGPKRVKEVLERMQVPSAERAGWPVLEWEGEIVWMKGAEVESKAGSRAGLKVVMQESRT
ncbi:MAG TPA: tRNA lysidine(34) synthetase TilS [Pseudacidobacterium sp.]|nr:tRNA lysidine(34) synthetase TilS [Pseudacidobacterium sp.]